MMTKKVLAILFLISITHPVYAQEEDVRNPADNNGSDIQTIQYRHNILLAFRPPIVGYTSVDGWIVNFIPITTEVPLHDRIGLSVIPTLLYYKSSIQRFQVIATIPFYAKKRTQERPYHGFYAAPLFGGAWAFHEEKKARAGFGVLVGYAWNSQKGFHFLIGLGTIFSVVDESWGGGLMLEAGYWLF